MFVFAYKMSLYRTEGYKSFIVICTGTNRMKYLHAHLPAACNLEEPQYIQYIIYNIHKACNNAYNIHTAPSAASIKCVNSAPSPVCLYYAVSLPNANPTCGIQRPPTHHGSRRGCSRSVCARAQRRPVGRPKHPRQHRPLRFPDSHRPVPPRCRRSSNSFIED